MYRVLIVDDEAVVRSTLATVVNWNDEGFCIVDSVSDGRIALDLAEAGEYDVVFTDIKMPVMDGVELVSHLSGLPRPPLVVVLSAYNDFSLVREAFRCSIHDYIMKSDINKEYLMGLLSSIRKKLDAITSGKPSAPPEITNSRENILNMMVLGNLPNTSFPKEDLLSGTWCLACFEIDDFKSVSLRFGADLASSLIQPMLTVSVQIPRVASDCILTGISFSKLIMLISGEDAVNQSRSICRRVQKLWSDYLNITCSVGISPAADSAEDFPDRLQSCNTYVTSKYLFGPGGIHTKTEMALFNTEEMSESIEGFRPLWSAMKDMNSEALISAMQNIFVIMYRSSLNNARNVALSIIYNMMLHLADAGVDLWQHLNTEKEENLYQQISGLENILDIERWSSNFIRWLFDYLEQQQITSKMNIMKKARRYISEHYSDSRLTLSVVANHVGLSEKYFSTRFARENDESFIDYLTNLRIGKAKQLIMKTDLKIYMVSDAVGFKSVEHFTRVFKKRVGISPRRYAEDKNE